MSIADAIPAAYLLLGIAAWLADFHWRPGKLAGLYKSAEDRQFAGSDLSAAVKWTLIVIVDFAMSVTLWPMLIYGLFVRAFDDAP